MARAKSSAAEICGGCGAEGELNRITGEKTHPILAVMNKDDAPDGATIIDNPDTSSDFVGVAVCKACHVDPAHRTKDKLKAHFFERQGNTAKVALMMAGSADIG